MTVRKSDQHHHRGRFSEHWNPTPNPMQHRQRVSLTAQTPGPHIAEKNPATTGTLALEGMSEILLSTTIDLGALPWWKTDLTTRPCVA